MDEQSPQCSSCTPVGPGPVFKRSEAVVIWLILAGIVAAITWFWKNPWVSAPLVAFLAIPISRIVRLTFLRILVVLAFGVGAFFLVGQWSTANAEYLTPVGLGSLQLGMSETQLEEAGATVESGGTVLSEYDGVWAYMTPEGTLGLITVTTSGPDGDSPEWSTPEGIQATSSVEEFMSAYPGASRYDGAGFSVAWARYGTNAIMLTSFGSKRGELELGPVDVVQAKYAETSKPEPPVTSPSNGSDGGYGWDQAYSDVMTGCLNEAQRQNGGVTEQDEVFCESYARSVADQMYK